MPWQTLVDTDGPWAIGRPCSCCPPAAAAVAGPPSTAAAISFDVDTRLILITVCREAAALLSGQAGPHS